MNILKRLFDALDEAEEQACGLKSVPNAELTGRCYES